MTDRLRVSHVIAETRAEGPGMRAAVWVQGCSIRCPGCFNPHTWPADRGRVTTWQEVADTVLSSTGLEGVTLLGGEPFEQAVPLSRLAARVRDAGLGVMTFTGRTHEALVGDTTPGVADLLATTDLLVDGPYRADLPDVVRPWVGSTNQRFLALTPRYADLVRRLTGEPDRLEVRIRADGTVEANGMASTADLESLFEGLRRYPRAG